MKIAETDSVLPQLVAAYDRGLLVPFVGAGISTPNCALWGEFVMNLEREAEIIEPPPPRCSHCNAALSPTELIQRAARAVRKLRYEQRSAMSGAVRSAIRSSTTATTVRPPGSEALAQISWPLVITTNYDDWFLGAWNSRFAQKRPRLEKMDVCGRSPADCERVLNSLRAADNPLLWAIQGFLGGFNRNSRYQCDTSPGKQEELAQQLVIRHAEYRREAYRSVGFRRAFSEVFRSRSLLFIGSGLSEGYFENLFDEVLELQGALPHLHYASCQRRRHESALSAGKISD
jgi:hypothetical protein